MNEILETDRLMLRQWQNEDRQALAEINDDPAVMRYFPCRFTAEESNVFIDTNTRHIAGKGWGNWAVETIVERRFIGFVGFSCPADWHPCAGRIEIGWRLGSQYWGLGYATEAATFVLKHGFESLGFTEIISYTSECNLPSVNVMKKIGMHREVHGFEHPRIDAGSPLRKHVIYCAHSPLDSMERATLQQE